jgi:hypothetical protein
MSSGNTGARGDVLPGRIFGFGGADAGAGMGEHAAEGG